MAGRRRNVRYRLSAALPAQLTILRDVAIERSDEREVIAVSDEPVRVGDELLLDVPNGRNRGRRRVRVLERIPFVGDGSMHYRLRLAVQA